MTLEERFQMLTRRWNNETSFISSLTEITRNSAYLEIVAMGEQAIPLILAELQSNPNHWFLALRLITGEDPAKEYRNFDDAVDAWIQWGRERGYVK